MFQKSLITILALLLLASGIFIFQNYSLVKKQESITQIVQNISDSSDKETQDWKTYSFEGVTFKYPKHWEPQTKEVFGSRSEVIFLGDENTKALRFSFIGNYNQITGKQYQTIDEYIGPKLNNEQFKIEDVTFNENSFKKIINLGMAGVHAVPTQEAAVFSKNRAAIISLLYYPKSFTDTYDKTLDNILSTFIFSDQMNISDWMIYPNQRYGFSIEYPRDITLEDWPSENLTRLVGKRSKGSEMLTEGIYFELSTYADIKRLKNRNSAGDAGMASSWKTTTKIIDGKEVLYVETKYSQINQETGKYEEDGQRYAIYTPIGNNFFILSGDMAKKDILDQMYSTFKFSDKAGADYLPEVVKLVKKDYLRNYSQEESSVAIASVQEEEWKDSSLGCPKAGQLYTQVITPGYSVSLNTDQGFIRYHTDKNTNFVKCY